MLIHGLFYFVCLYVLSSLSKKFKPEKAFYSTGIILFCKILRWW